MFSYIIRRVISIIPTLFIISIISFTIIELPPGDFLETRIMQLEEEGHEGAREEMEHLKQRYGLDRPAYQRYINWISHFIVGDFGESFRFNKPVSELIGERLALTAIMSLCTTLFIWLIAIPVGVYSATHQYSAGDMIATIFGFLGLATPNFLLALVLLVAGLHFFGEAPIGLFSQAFEDAPWSIAKVIDLFKHLWVPVIVLGTAGTAGFIRTMRGNLLDELGRQYIQTARAKGLKESIVIYKHALRNAVHPMIMGLAHLLPSIISGAAIVSIVLGLPTTGPLYLQALQEQDMYLAGSFLMFVTILLLIGNLLADILLAIVDPRIRYD